MPDSLFICGLINEKDDLLYFDQDCNSVVDHAAIISDVSDNIIKYAAHTDPPKSKRLKGSKNKKSKKYILIMR